MKHNRRQNFVHNPKGPFWLKCPFCQSYFITHMVRYRLHGHMDDQTKGASGSTLDLDDLLPLLQELPVDQIAAMYGISAREVEHACQAFGIGMNARDEKS